MNRPALIWGGLVLVALVFGGIIGYSIINPPDDSPPPFSSGDHCDNTYELSGTVTGMNERPISGATVVIMVVGELPPNDCPTPIGPSKQQTITDTDGTFSLSLAGTPNMLFQLSISAPHYEPYLSPPVNGAYLRYSTFADLHLQSIAPRIFG